MDWEEFLWIILATFIYYLLVKNLEGINPTLDIILDSEIGAVIGIMLILVVMALVWRLFYEIKKRLKK